MKKKFLLVIAVVVVIGVIIWGAYYWRKKADAPPAPLVYTSQEALDGIIRRLENKSRPLSWQDAHTLGVAYLHADRLESAVKTLEEARRLKPDFDKTYESLGMAYYRLGRLDKAIVEWEASIAMNPKSTHLKNMITRGREKLEVGKRIKTLEEEAKKGSAPLRKRLELAILYLTVNRADDAIKELEALIKEKKDESFIYDSLAQAYAMKGDFEKAVFFEKKAVKLTPDDKDLKTKLKEMEEAKKIRGR